MAQQQLQQWLQNFGTAQVELGTDNHFKPHTASLDLLVPLYKNDERILFTQNGVRNKDGQITGNFGLGQRHFAGDWMVGYNAFYDQNFSRGHKRFGTGVEAWRDYLKLSGNGYYRLSGWRDSGDVEDYDARPASGFDLRTEAWLPAYPSLGAKLIYEKYYGNEVALFGKDKRQKNPDAITAGLSYTPVPLISLSAEHKKGGSQDDTIFGLQLTYQLGQPMSSQIDPANVALQRTLAGSALDLVERNNNIVLEYRKKELMNLILPKEISGTSGSLVPVSYQLSTKYALSHILWNDAALVAAGGKIQDMGNGQYQIALPKYVAGAANSYVLSAVAYDVRKNTSRTATTTVSVARPAVNAQGSSITTSQETILADGKATATISITLQDEEGQSVDGMAKALQLSVKEEQAKTIMAMSQVPAQPAVISEIAEQGKGVYTATLTAATRPALAVISATVDGQALKNVEVNQVSDVATATIKDSDISLVVNNAAANGSATNEVRARVTDATGNPVSGVAVNFSLSGSAQVAAGSSLTAVSGSDGYVSVLLTDTVAETIAVTAATANGSAKASVVFTADTATAIISEDGVSVDRADALANGQDAVTYTATVKDANGNPIANALVNWTTDSGTLSGATSTTDSNGKATIKLTHTLAQMVQVQASVGKNKAVNAPKVSFGADAATGGIASGDLTRDKDTAIANGADSITYSVIVKDATGNVLADQTVQWESTLGSLSAVTSKTDSSGVATIELSSITSGSAVVSAALAMKPAVNAQAVNFSADGSTAKIESSDLKADKTNIVADASDAATFTARVKDANGNPVSGQNVSWTTDHGTLSVSSSVTNGSGDAFVKLTGTAAGTAQVTAAANGNTAVNAPQVTLIADSSSAQIDAGSLTADKSSALANGTELVTYTAVVKDANGNPVSGATVSWTTNFGHLASSSSSTDSDGKATVTLNSAVAGNAVVEAQVGTSGAISAAAVIFIADAGSAVIGSGDMTVDKTTVVANGTDAATYTAMVKDANGNPLSGFTVSWSTDKGSLSASSSTTDSAGKATIKLGHTKAEAAVVTATVRGTDTDASTVSFIGDIATAKVDSIASDKAKITGTGVETATLTATITDANGNSVAGFKPTWLTTTGAIADNGASDSTGKATAVLTAPVLEAKSNGTATVTANGVSRSVAVRAVLKAGTLMFWTMASDHLTSVESTANGYCATYGGGKAAGETEFATFLSENKDFKDMAVTGEFSDARYYIASKWQANWYADFNSLHAAIGIRNDTLGANNGYVCVK